MKHLLPAIQDTLESAGFGIECALRELGSERPGVQVERFETDTQPNSMGFVMSTVRFGFQDGSWVSVSVCDRAGRLSLVAAPKEGA